ITVLLFSLLSILAFTRVGLILFWRSSKPDDDPESEAHISYQALPSRAPTPHDKVVYPLLSVLPADVILSSPIYNFVFNTAVQLKDNPVYEAALLQRNAEGHVISVQPFDPEYVPETKYGGEVADPNAHLIPYVISPATLEGENISEFKQRQ